jgi:tetratricopeptide (TPR) repeat protein
MGLRRGLAHVANEAGIVARARGDHATARRMHLEALAILRESVPFRVPRALALAAAAEVRLGRFDDAAGHLREAARTALDLPQLPLVPLILATSASIAAAGGEAERAAELLGAAEAVNRRAGADAAAVYADEAALAAGAATAPGTGISPTAYQAALERGRTLDPEAALRLAVHARGPDGSDS